MAKTLNANSIMKIGKEAGANLIGICDVSMLRAANPEADAEKFLRGARVIVISAVADPPYITSAKDSVVYSRLSFPGYLKADGVSTAISAMIEEQGYSTKRVERSSTHTLDRSWRISKVLPIKKAAELAGLGTIGRNQLLITPKFGPRVRMSAFITDAPLEPGKPLTDNLCDCCNVCMKNCPGGAFGSDGNYDVIACSTYLFSGLNIGEIKENFFSAPFDTFKNNIKNIRSTATGWIDAISERRLLYNCGNCVRLCNGHLVISKEK